MPERDRDRLAEAMTLEDPAPQDLKVLLARRFDLENLLVDLADEKYLTGRVAELYGEGPGTAVTWRILLGDDVPALLEGFVPAGGDELRRTKRQATRLLHAKQAEDEVARGRGELIDRAVPRTTAVVAVLAAILAVAAATVVDPDDGLLLAMASGGTGAGLGGLLRLRDEIQWGSQARRFWMAFVGQVLVGFIAGTLAFLLSRSGAVRVGGGDAGVAVLAMALGFSEAAFLRLLARFTAP